MVNSEWCTAIQVLLTTEHSLPSSERDDEWSDARDDAMKNQSWANNQ
jgi:hypothetical protein